MKTPFQHILLALLTALVAAAHACSGGAHHVHSHFHDLADEAHRQLGRSNNNDDGTRFGSHRCGQREPTVEERQETDRVLRDFHNQRLKNRHRRLETITIPVYFFNIVAADGRDSGKVREQQIQDQMDALNDAFSPDFVFELIETEIIRDTDLYNCEYKSDKTKQMKQDLRKGGADSLNLFSCLPAERKLGWATFPEYVRKNGNIDGVVILDQTMPGGGAAPYNRGNTAVHEVGHWLGLYHTFEGGCNVGDGVSDTPAEKGPTYGCPKSANSCPNSPGADSVRNYMNFVDDVCMESFTPGQVERMQAMWEQYRVGGGSSRRRGSIGTSTTATGSEPTPEPTPEPTQEPESSEEDPTPSPTSEPTESADSDEAESAECLPTTDKCSDGEECCSGTCSSRGRCTDPSSSSGGLVGGSGSGGRSDTTDGATTSRGGSGGRRGGGGNTDSDTDSSTTSSGTGGRRQGSRRGGR